MMCSVLSKSLPATEPKQFEQVILLPMCNFMRRMVMLGEKPQSARSFSTLMMWTSVLLLLGRMK